MREGGEMGAEDEAMEEGRSDNRWGGGRMSLVLVESG